MSANRSAGGRGCRRWTPVLAALAIVCGGAALAQVVSVPAAHLQHAEGSVAVAPQGEREWQDVQPRRLLKRGDRIWTDRGSRAELQAGGHALRLDGQTQLVLENVGETATQLSLTQGSVAATVTRMNAGDSFEVGTPNLAFRARQSGDYRIDVDTKQGVTRIVVQSGAGVVYGEKGEAMEVRNGQRLTFRERNLTRMLQPAFATTDDFDRWAGARRRGEPTVSMPSVAAATPASAPAAPATSYNGRTIVISGSAESLKQPAAAKGATAAARVAPAQPVAAAQGARPLATTMPAAAALKVGAPAVSAAAATRQALPSAAQAQADAAANARAEARAQAAARAEQDRRIAAAEARRAEDRRRVAKRAEDARRQALAKRAQEQKRVAAKHAEEERRLAAVRKAEAQKLAEARRQQLARLQEQARREEQSVQARREQAARRAEDERREEQARREDAVRQEELARREEADRRLRALAEQARRDQARRNEDVWLRQQQYQQQPRPTPMGVPARKIS